MQAAARPYVLASAAMLATGAIAAMPLAPRPVQPPVVSMPVRLVDDSIANIPVNLFDDILNIPYNEVQALDQFADSDFFTGTWFIPSATNLWGIDPGDTSRVEALTDLAAPFQGLDSGPGGLVDDISGFLAAELPVSASCDAATCAPILPPDVITGDTAIDRDINLFESLFGNPQLGLLSGWFQVPLSELTSGYTFGTSDPLDAGVTDPSGPAFSGFGFLNNSSDPYVGATGADNAMPWDGTTYSLSLTQPFENFYDSLLATPSTSGIDGTGIDLPSFQDLIYALQANAAGFLVDFDPIIEGSPECPGTCDIPESLTLYSLVQDIGNLDPGNPMINEWLAGYGTTDNEPTPTQIDQSIAEYQVGDYNLTPAELTTVDTDLTNINPELPILLTNAGVYTDPGYLAYTDGASPTFEATYGGYDPSLVAGDLQTLLTNNDWNYSALNGDVLATLLDPAAAASAASSTASPDAATLSSELSALLGGSGNGTTASDLANLSALLGLGGASTLSTDLGALLSTLSTDISGGLSADLGTTLSTDLASILPSALLSAI